ncbi:ATP-grasp domain-containing protein [Arenibaculum sp.]|jgi:biotin carboxylase|uniref:ATP-grasp domain-containing protein n=1 Tax=Arenibaculum sp. TaxID=2865862 RepID=UPI002E1418B0|nr:ATP-grasp domain-containing protein [Arenibaculum sp.]
MKHLVFADTNHAGLFAIRTAKALGYRVGLVRSPDFRPLYAGPLADEVLSQVDRIVDVEDSTDEDQLLQALAALDAEAPVDGAVAVMEYTSLPLARAAERAGIRATPRRAVELARDKQACRRALEAAGIASARHARVDRLGEALAAAASIGYPVVVKPVSGAGSLLAARIDDDRAMEAYFARHDALLARLPRGMARAAGGSLLVEEHLDGPLLSVEIGAARGRILRFMVSGRKRGSHNEILELGTTMPAGIPAPARAGAFAYAEAIVRTLGLDLGIFHIEVILTATGPRLVEVNPRLMGASLPTLYRHATGVDIHAFLARIHVGEAVEDPPADALRAATSRVTAAAVDATVRADLAPDWLAPFAPHLVEHAIRVRPGQALPAMISNHESFGYFQVVADDPAASADLGDRLVRGIGEALGVRLAD